MKIFLDLDGTILDSKARLYFLFQYLVKNSKLTYYQYWELKSNKISHEKILSRLFNYDDNCIRLFLKEWLEEIEKENWLKYDYPFEFSHHSLSKLKEYSELFLITSRQFELNALNQLKNFDLQNYFKDILITKQAKTKFDIIRKNYKTKSLDWIVGDCGTDIITGKKLGIRTAAVLSGFQRWENLFEYNPDIIERNINEIDFINGEH